MKLLLALSFVCSLACAAAPAQTPRPPEGGSAAQPARNLPPELAEAERLNAEINSLYQAGKFADAVPLARRVLEIRERAFGVEHVATLYALANLATLYVEVKKDGEAEPLFKRALAAAEKLGAPARLLVIEVSNKLAAIRFRDRDYEGTETHLRRALDLIVAARGAEDLAAVPVLLNFTDLSYQRGKAEAAEAHLARAVEILLKHPPRRDPATSERLKRYVCLLAEDSREGELSKSLGRARYRLEEPEKAAERERRERERAERGEGKPTVQGGVLNGRVLARVAPAYPAEAKERRLSGKVVVQITVDETGKVVHAERFCGNPILSEAGVAAVKRWRFSPTLLDGKPVAVTGTVTVNFILRP
ncbi:MAG: TonB family protein [Acidobacteriota bacterium]|nr:TonB family protein [Acidobacteriota bacterium]